MPTADSSSRASALRRRLRSSYATANSSLSSPTAHDDDTASAADKLRTTLTGTASAGHEPQVAEPVSQTPVSQSQPETPQITPPTALQLDVAERVIQDTLARRETPIEQEQAQDTPQASQAPQNDPTAVAFPTAVEQAHHAQLNPPHASSAGQRESISTPTSPDFGSIDAIPGVQSVEEEPLPELSPEVASYLEKTEKRIDQLPEEISIVAEEQAQLPTRTAKKPVIVLPITPEVEAKGKKKNTSWSVRWLVEWSRKIMKMFAGDVVYRTPSS